jgi:hypothetical protein
MPNATAVTLSTPESSAVALSTKAANLLPEPGLMLSSIFIVLVQPLKVENEKKIGP